MSQVYKILIVEDDVDYATLIEKAIRKIEMDDVTCPIEKAINYDQATQLIKNDFPDLVVLDVKMTGLSGLYVAAYVTAHAINHDLVKPKIIFVSGGFEDKESIVRKANMLGATFLWKPLDIKILINLVENHIRETYPLAEEPKAAVHEVDGIVMKLIDRLTKEEQTILRDLEHYVAHLIMELQFFRTKAKDLPLGSEEEDFLEEMFEIETKTMQTFEKLKQKLMP